MKEKQAEQRKIARKAKEDRESIIAKGRSRPMLIDSYNSGTHRADNLLRAKTINKFSEVLKKNGLSDAEIQKNHLDLEDKEALEEAKFYEMQKKQYGK